MHKLYTPFAAAIIIFLFPSLLKAQQTVQGVLRIKVSESLAAKLEQNRISQNFSGEVVTGIESLDRINSQFQVRKFTRVFPHAGKYESRHRRHGLHLWYEVRMNEKIPVANALQSYQSDKQILRAEPVYQKAIIGSSSANTGPRIINEAGKLAGKPLMDAPNDPLLSGQWHYNNTGQTGGTAGADIKLFEAWKVETGNPDVIIAVTDGGIQTDHPDLAANIWVNPGEIPDNDIDDDNNGYVDDVHGYGFVNKSSNILPHDHGTHVAGTLAAVNNNGTGVAGVAGGSGNGDGIRIMSCAVFTYDSLPDGFAEAYVYAADNGAVINQNSWGYTVPGAFEHVVLEALDYFMAEAGKNDSGQQVGPVSGGLAIFSAGNFNDEGNFYPAFYEPVIAVASTDHKDTRAFYSNYGDWVDISAPGGETDISDAEGVISTLTNGQYGSFMGTSMACPHVSGVAALIISKYARPGLRAEAVRARLLLSTDDINPLNTAYAGKLGSGRLNAALALRPGDSSGPEAITNLAVESTAVGEITLTWTSPRDEGDFVAAYDLRYATSPITESNFNNATRVDDVPAPKSPGSAERFTVKGLPGGITFFFAIRSKDFEENASPLSNVISQESELTPVMFVAPLTIEENLKTAEHSARNFTIRNDGEGPLKFSIEDQGDSQSFAKSDPLQGELAPGEQQEIAVNFDASGKRAGTYQQDIVVSGNDPLRPTTVVKLALNVVDNGAPIASAEPDAIDFKSAQIGQVVFRSVTVHNAGSDPLVIPEISFSNDAFSSHSSAPLTVAPFQDVILRLVFSPTAAGFSTGTVIIHTNDPVNEQLTIALQGEGLSEAAVAITPAYFNETLEKGTTVTRNLTLKNNGSQPRNFRIATLNYRLSRTEAQGRTKQTKASEVQMFPPRKLREHQERFSAKRNAATDLVRPLPYPDNSATKESNTGRISTAFIRELREYATGFEEFASGRVGEQHGWFATLGWTIASQNAGAGSKHLRGISQVSGLGEAFCISPYIFEYDEMYYPQYTTAALRLNMDKAKGTTWEVVPQDPWSYVATRLRFNADGTLDALVIDNEYNSHWKRVPAAIPSGYFDLAIEYNNAGSDTSGFPTFLLFINNHHVFSGTGLASGIGQLAFVSPMETTGPVMDADDVRVTGGEFIPSFVETEPSQGTLQPGESVSVGVTFDASLVKSGTFESDLVVYLDEIDSLTIPVSLTVPGEASLFRDTHSIFWVLEKEEEGFQEVFLRNDGGETVTFSFQHDISGLTIHPESGSLQVREEAFVELRFNGPPGIYEDSIFFQTSLRPEPFTMPVFITRFDSGAVFSAPDTLRINAVAGEVTSETLQLRNEGVNTVSFTSELSSAINPIMSLDPNHSTIRNLPLNVNVSIDATDLTPGTITGIIQFNTNDPQRRKAHTHVVLTVEAHGPEHFIVREVWANISGTAVSTIPVNSPPSYTQQLASFQAPSNTGDSYGARIRGYLLPPVSGPYTFWIASNDHSELWLSEDETEGRTQKIAYVTGYTNPGQWTKYPSQLSKTIYLEANKKYYIEALHKEGTGSDHLAVAWKLPDGSFEGPIPATRMLPYQSTGNCSATGAISREFWTGVRGTHVSDIPVNTAPSGTETLTLFEGPVNAGINYGARIRGYICAPQTGNYYFWIASNDHSELWLSTDEDPAKRRQIAMVTRATGMREWNRFPSQKSGAIFLTQGQTYYIEALHKQGIGTDHVAVGWNLPDGTFEGPIAGSRLSPYREQLASASLAYFAEVEERVRAFPNPIVGEKLNVTIPRWPSELNPSREIAILDVSGVRVYSEILECMEGCTTSVDVDSKLKPGIYILRVTTAGGKVFTEKLVVR